MDSREEHMRHQKYMSIGYGLERLGQGFAWGCFWFALAWTLVEGVWG